MRILEAFGEPISFGGQEAFVLNVLSHMNTEGMEVDFLTPYYCDNPSACDIAAGTGGSVSSLGCGFRPGHRRKSEEKPLRRYLSEHRYDVIHIHSGSNSMLEMYARLAYKAGIKRIIVHSHCTGKRGPVHTLSKALTSYGLRKYPTDWCACSSDAGRWRFPAWICDKRLRLINDGIDIDRFSFDPAVRAEVRAGLGLGDDDVLIGNAGRLSYQKNQEFLLRIMAEIGDPEYKLLIAGDGEERDKLSSLIRELGIEDKVIMPGRSDNMPGLYQAMDLFVMSSRYEGLCIAVIEAQASGLEVIVSEGVPKAADLTGAVKCIPLGMPEKWIESIRSPHVRHPENAGSVRAAGYDIRDTAAAVRSMYMEER